MSLSKPGIYDASFRAIAAHPVAGFRFFLGQHANLQDEIILKTAKIVCQSDFQHRVWKQALSELRSEDLVSPRIDPGVGGNSHKTTLGKWLYCLVRVARPAIVIETGVSRGISSWLILNGLAKNNHGTLYSIDLPNRDTNQSYNVGKEDMTGCAVPDELRPRWKLEFGDTRILLPKLLNTLRAVDVFFHDSDHSYDSMLWEFNTVSPYLRGNGFVVSDDVQRNNAFCDWVMQKRLVAVQFRKGGVARGKLE